MKYENVAIVLTFFSLWLSVLFTHPLQEVIAFFLIFSFGILHGSNDLSLIAKVSNTTRPLRLALFIASYVVTVAVASLLFYYLPIIALVVFILFSAFHFGEQHWSVSIKLNVLQNRLLFLNYGLSLLFLLFYLNFDATQTVVYSLAELTLLKEYVLWAFAISTLFWIVQAIFLVVQKQIAVQRLIFEVFLVLVFAIVFKTATLIWAFAIYFIFWHSIPSIMEQQLFLYGEISKRTFIQYVKSSFFIYAVSIVSIILLFLWLDDEAIFLPLLFAFLGAITFAHSFTISKMFRLKKKVDPEVNTID